MSFENETAAALPAVARACEICARARKTGFSAAEKKSDGSPVTAADYAAQFVLTKAIAEKFPNDEIVAEESAKNLSGMSGKQMLAKISSLLAGSENEPSQTAGHGRALPAAGRSEIVKTLARGSGTANSRRFWAIDPVDGTAGFTSGGQFAVAVALIENGRAALGILGCPGLGFIMWGSRKSGLFTARIDGSGRQRAEISKPLKEKTVFCETARGSKAAYRASQKIIKNFGRPAETLKMDSQCKYALAASGRADVFLRVPNAGGRRENVWDHAAGTAIVESAGGCVSDFDGRTLNFSEAALRSNRGVVAARGEVYEDVMKAIRSAGV